MQYQFRVAAFAVISFAMSVLSSCSKDNNNPVTPPVDTVGTTPKGTGVMIANTTKFGAVLTDSLGKTLYFFANDAAGVSTCTGGCIAAWPVFYKEVLTVDSTLVAADFGVITRADGSKQNTYKGWPLYYYNQDTKAGDMNGDPVGNVWFVAKPDYSVMLANFQLTGNDNVQYTGSYTPGTGATQFITDAYGRTLYAFSHDANKTNVYTKADLSNEAAWPIYQVDTIKNIPSILDKAAFVKITVFGRTQLTYKGWPLYYFGNDQQTRGNTKGVSVPTPGVWPIVNVASTEAPAPSLP